MVAPTFDDMLAVPAGYSIETLLGPIDYDAMRFSAYRRYVCAHNPILFALTYLPHHLRSEETGNLLSLNQMHVDMAADALTMTRGMPGIRGHRKIWIGPRDIGKSTWKFVILVLWALCFKYIKFPALFSDSGDQSQRHFRSMKKELESNELLREDFPELCQPAKRRGNRSDTDNAHEYIASSGQKIFAKGIDAKTIGLKVDSDRPDYIGFDDIEPQASKYTPEQRDKRLRTMIDAIMGMNLRAFVEVVGTSVMYKSLIHQAAIAATGGHVAEWISEERFKTRYYPAIVRLPNGQEESIWPQKWPLRDLVDMRNTRAFMLNFMNMPVSSSNGMWTTTHFKYGYDFMIEESVLTIDPAMTSHDKSDHTGIAVVGRDASGTRTVVEYAVGVHLGPQKTRELVHYLLMHNPKITTVILEKNAGADYVLERLMPWPRRVHLLNPHEGKAKTERIGDLLDYYERGWVWHANGLVALQDQMLAYPDVDRDDVIDAVARGVDHFLRRRRAA
jgi:hypothetical protein